MYSVPTGLSTLAAAEVPDPRVVPDDGEGDPHLVAVERHAGDGSHLHPVDGDDVPGLESAGVGEVGL